jgi:hypothetical protein
MKTPLPATDLSVGRSLKTLTKSDFRTLGLATLGGALEFYDFIIFVFFANQIGQLFFPAEIPDWLRQFQTFGLFAVAYFVRPLSGIINGAFWRLDRSKANLCNLWWIDPTDRGDLSC